MRSYAVVPPIMLDSYTRKKCMYIDNNSEILDVDKEFKESKFYNVWSEAENEVCIIMGLNDDLSSTLTVHQVAETRSKIDCPINDPDAILQIMFSGRHISVKSTGRSWDDLVSAT